MFSKKGKIRHKMNTVFSQPAAIITSDNKSPSIELSCTARVRPDNFREKRKYDMKKKLCVILAAGLMLSACGSQGGTQPETAAQETIAEAEDPKAAKAAMAAWEAWEAAVPSTRASI